MRVVTRQSSVPRRSRRTNPTVRLFRTPDEAEPADNYQPPTPPKRPGGWQDAQQEHQRPLLPPNATHQPSPVWGFGGNSRITVIPGVHGRSDQRGKELQESGGLCHWKHTFPDFLRESDLQSGKRRISDYPSRLTHP